MKIQHIVYCQHLIYSWVNKTLAVFSIWAIISIACSLCARMTPMIVRRFDMRGRRPWRLAMFHVER